MDSYQEELTLEELALVEMNRTCRRLGVVPPIELFRHECFERLMKCNNGDRVAITGFLVENAEHEKDIVFYWKLHNKWKTCCCPHMWIMDHAPTEEMVKAWGYEILPQNLSPSEICDAIKRN